MNGKESSLLINSSILLAINSIINFLDLAARRPIEKINTKQIIYEEDLNKIKYLQGADIIPYLKLGTRVVRGEDWKWDNQVCINLKSNLFFVLYKSKVNFFHYVLCYIVLYMLCIIYRMVHRVV